MKHELTVTLRPMLYGHTAKQQFDITSPMLKTSLAGHKSTIVAELTQEHNVHYHCLVELEGTQQKDRIINRLRQFNKYFGKKTFKCVMFEESYEKYLIKSYHDTTKLITDPIVQDDFKVTDSLHKDIFITVRPRTGDSSRSARSAVTGATKRASSGGAPVPNDYKQQMEEFHNNVWNIQNRHNEVIYQMNMDKMV